MCVTEHWLQRPIVQLSTHHAEQCILCSLFACYNQSVQGACLPARTHAHAHTYTLTRARTHSILCCNTTACTVSLYDAYLSLIGAVAPSKQHNLSRQLVGVAQGGAPICRHPSHQRVGRTRADSTCQAVAKISKQDCVGGITGGGGRQGPINRDLVCVVV